jgi:CheY-like chemotaxis protein
MEDGKGQIFDLLALLRINDLDIRKVAFYNPSLLVKDYFAFLEKFLRHAPELIGALKKISDRKAAEYDFRNLGHGSRYLEDLGCYKILPVIEDIVSAGKMGHSDFAANHAQKALPVFDNLNAKITEAKREQAAEIIAYAIDEWGPAYNDIGTQLLKNILKLLEYGEATRKMRILAVDDSPVIVKTISSVLSEEYKVYGMTNPTMLGKFLRQITPDLFLLDYKMPELSGFELVPIIRRFSEHKDTPIIFLTSEGTMAHISAAFALGACDFIVKPVQNTILREKIAKHIVRKKLF